MQCALVYLMVDRSGVQPQLRQLQSWQAEQRRRGRAYQPRFRRGHRSVTWLGALLALALLGLLSAWSGMVLLAAPLGASSVLLFGYPASPLAQPRNIVLGNLMGGPGERGGGGLAGPGALGDRPGGVAHGAVGPAVAMPASSRRWSGLSWGGVRGHAAVCAYARAQRFAAAGADRRGLQPLGKGGAPLPAPLAVTIWR